MAFSGAYEFFPWENAPGITFSKMDSAYISYNSWKICYIMELQPYFEEIHALETNIMELKNMCNILSDGNQMCETQVDRLKSQLKKSKSKR